MENVEQKQQPIYTYKYADKKSATMIIIGITMIVVGFLFHPIPFAIGVLYTIQGFVFKSLEAIQIYSKHSEIKLLMLGSRVYLDHSKISKVELVKDKVLHITYDKNGKNKVFKLPVFEFREEDKAEIKDFYLNQVLTQNQSKSQQPETEGLDN